MFASKDWDVVRHALPGASAATRLDEIHLPLRIRTYVERERLRTVADLAARSQADLLEAKNLGCRSISALVEALRTHVGHVKKVRSLSKVGLLESWQGLLEEQDSMLWTVLTQRAALGVTPRPVRAVGRTLGISGQRVQQLEAMALGVLKRERLWLDEVRRRLDRVLHDGAVTLDELARDPWWASIAAKPWALGYLNERLLDGAAHVLTVDGRLYLARCTPAEFEQASAELRNQAAKLPLPSPVATFRALADMLVPKMGRILSDLLFERLRGLLHIEQPHGEAYVVGFGTTRAGAVLAFLLAQPQPVRVAEVVERVGRGDIPDEVLFFDGGCIGVEQHVPHFRDWIRHIVPLAVEAMKREPPERQWLAVEILADLDKVYHMPKWLDHWHLTALLRKSGRVRYLGRNRFLLPEAPKEQGRIHYHVEIERILNEHGGPMSRQALVAELRKKVSPSRSAINHCLAQPRFIACERNTIGLRDRDVPSGDAALARALDHVWGVLKRRRRGLHKAQIKAEISKLSKHHASWPAEMCSSVLRGDARFRLSTSGAAGLSEWEGVRAPSQIEIVRQCLEGAKGPVSIQFVQERFKTSYGTKPDRMTLRRLANKLGAVLKGEWLEQARVSRRHASRKRRRRRALISPNTERGV